MLKIYIASPYTLGNKEENVKSQIECANELIKLGFAPYIPTLSHYVDILYPQSWEKWMELDLEWLKQCNCLIRLSGKSKGADLEVKFAQDYYNIPVFYSIDELVKEYKK